MPKISNLLAAVLDTHVWIWASQGDERAQALDDFTGAGILSAISVWEVAMLSMKGRLILEPDPDTWISANLSSPISLEPISPDIALASCRLLNFHGDSADRMIVATALTLGLPLITADSKIIAWNQEHRLLQVIEL